MYWPLITNVFFKISFIAVEFSLLIYLELKISKMRYENYVQLFETLSGRK